MHKLVFWMDARTKMQRSDKLELWGELNLMADSKTDWTLLPLVTEKFPRQLDVIWKGQKNISCTALLLHGLRVYTGEVPTLIILIDFAFQRQTDRQRSNLISETSLCFCVHGRGCEWHWILPIWAEITQASLKTDRMEAKFRKVSL